MVDDDLEITLGIDVPAKGGEQPAQVQCVGLDPRLAMVIGAALG